MIAILGAGAFGSALALAVGDDVRLWGRGLPAGSRSAPRLPGYGFTARITVVGTPDEAIQGADLILLAVPMKAVRETLASHPNGELPLIACCKGLEPSTALGPVTLISDHWLGAIGILTGPSFATDIAAGLPTALTLAMEDANERANAQARIASSTLRIYGSDDTRGAELGGALKNVLAIAAGAVDGAGLGQSAQAALITRGFAELRGLAEEEGATSETLLGLSGLGDLMLTGFSPASRNYRYGQALGAGRNFAEDTTVEGVATAAAITTLARKHGHDTPVLTATNALIKGTLSIEDAVAKLMSRPLKEE